MSIQQWYKDKDMQMQARGKGMSFCSNSRWSCLVSLQPSIKLIQLPRDVNGEHSLNAITNRTLASGDERWSKISEKRWVGSAVSGTLRSHLSARSQIHTECQITKHVWNRCILNGISRALVRFATSNSLQHALSQHTARVNIVHLILTGDLYVSGWMRGYHRLL